MSLKTSLYRVPCRIATLNPTFKTTCSKERKIWNFSRDVNLAFPTFGASILTTRLRGHPLGFRASALFSQQRGKGDVADDSADAKRKGTEDPEDDETDAAVHAAAEAEHEQLKLRLERNRETKRKLATQEVMKSPALHRVEEQAMVVPPISWRNPGEWVDLEYERAGLNADAAAGEEGALESPWRTDDFEHPDMNVLWPSRALNEHRSRPFSIPRMAPSDKKDLNSLQVLRNRDRLSVLWRISGSHGISWDELDDAYVRFAEAGGARYRQWATASGTGALALYEKEQAKEKVRDHLRRFAPAGKDPAQLWPSHHRRLTARLYRQIKKKWLSPFRPGRLSSHLRQLVAARMCRRETEERTLGLGAHPIREK